MRVSRVIVLRWRCGRASGLGSLKSLRRLPCSRRRRGLGSLSSPLRRKRLARCLGLQRCLVDGTLRFLPGRKFGRLCGCELCGVLGGQSRLFLPCGIFGGQSRLFLLCGMLGRQSRLFLLSGMLGRQSRPFLLRCLLGSQPCLFPLRGLMRGLLGGFPCGILRDQFSLPGLFRGACCFGQPLHLGGAVGFCAVIDAGEVSQGRLEARLGRMRLLGLKGLRRKWLQLARFGLKRVRIKGLRLGRAWLGLGRGGLLGFQRLLNAQPDLFPRLCPRCGKVTVFCAVQIGPGIKRRDIFRRLILVVRRFTISHTSPQYLPLPFLCPSPDESTNAYQSCGRPRRT